MKIWIIALLLSLFSIGQVQAVEAELSYARFQTVEEEPYVELYLLIVSSSLQFQPVEGGEQARVRVELRVRQADSLVFSDIYRIESPLAKLGEGGALNLVDQRRIGLDAGLYKLELLLIDESSGKRYEQTEVLQMKAYENVALSDIQLLNGVTPSTDKQHPFYRSGHLFQPQPLAFYNRYKLQLLFYTEAYHLPDTALALHYFLEDRSNGRSQKNTEVYKRMPKHSSLHPLFFRLDIKDVISGDYDLVVQLQTRDKLVLAESRQRILRSNPILPVRAQDYTKLDARKTFADSLKKEELRYALRASRPISMATENAPLRGAIESDDVVVMKRYLNAFWLRRDNINPGKAYSDYIRVVRIVDKSFGSKGRPGFEADMGYYFLRYGAPSNIQKGGRNEGETPFQIWHYNVFGENERNVDLIFYNPTLVPGKFEILHSTSVDGVKQPNWQQVLQLQSGANVNDGFMDE